MKTVVGEALNKKSNMKKVEILFWVILFALTVARIFATVNFLFILLSGFLLADYYIICGFFILNDLRLADIFNKNAYRNLSPLRIVGSILMSIAYAVVVVSVTFKLLCWPGSKAMLFIAIVLLTTSMFICISKYKRDRNFYKKIIKRNIAFLGICIFLFVILLMPQVHEKMFPIPSKNIQMKHHAAARMSIVNRNFLWSSALVPTS